MASGQRDGTSIPS